MNKNEIGFLEPGSPFIILRKLRMESIEKAIHDNLKNDTYWLKLHYFSANIDNDIFNKLQKDQDSLSWSWKGKLFFTLLIFYFSSAYKKM